jgi:hypothetical protein
LRLYHICISYHHVSYCILSFILIVARLILRSCWGCYGYTWCALFRLTLISWYELKMSLLIVNLNNTWKNLKHVHHYLWQLACVGVSRTLFASYICLVAMAHTLSYIFAWETWICANTWKTRYEKIGMGLCCPMSEYRDNSLLHLRVNLSSLMDTKITVLSFLLLLV